MLHLHHRDFFSFHAAIFFIPGAHLERLPSGEPCPELFSPVPDRVPQ